MSDHLGQAIEAAASEFVLQTDQMSEAEWTRLSDVEAARLAATVAAPHIARGERERIRALIGDELFDPPAPGVESAYNQGLHFVLAVLASLDEEGK